jgi:hypothetical protein
MVSQSPPFVIWTYLKYRGTLSDILTSILIILTYPAPSVKRPKYKPPYSYVGNINTYTWNYYHSPFIISQGTHVIDQLVGCIM